MSAFEIGGRSDEDASKKGVLLAWLLFRAAFQADSGEAGDTGKAFHFLEAAWFGSYLLGALGPGLVCYGVFNFVRARFERF